MMIPSNKRSIERVKRLPAVIFALNSEITRLTGKKPKDAIKSKSVGIKPSTSIIPGRAVGLKKNENYHLLLV